MLSGRRLSCVEQPPRLLTGLIFPAATMASVGILFFDMHRTNTLRRFRITKAYVNKNLDKVVGLGVKG
jgi:hypothetical protein